MKNLHTKKTSNGSNFGWLIQQMSVNQKSGRQTFRRRFVSRFVFVTPCPPECYLKSETKIEPDLRLRYLRRCYRLSPSPFPPFFVHSCFRCSRASFASPSLFSLIYTDREPGTAYCTPQSKIQNPTLQFDLD